MSRRTAAASSLVPVLAAALLLASCKEREPVQPTTVLATPANPSATPRELWDADCTGCHGQAGKGDTGRGADMKIPDMSRPMWQAGRTNAQLSRVIRDGYSGTTVGVRQHMNAFRSELTEEQVQGLVALVRGFQVR